MDALAGMGVLPQHLQLKVLSMLDDGAFDKVVDSAASAPAAAPVRASDGTFLRPVAARFSARRAVDDITQRGVAVFDNFLGGVAAGDVRAAADDIAGRGLMRKARMGKDGTQWADARARGDDMIWFNELLALLQTQGAADTGHTVSAVGSGGAGPGEGVDASAARSIQEVHKAVCKLKEVGEEVSSAIGGQFECSRMTFQLARYSNGARYVRHSDVSPQTPDRRLTCIYYMNPDWKKQDGGELRLYLPEGRGGVQGCTNACDVAPLMDRLLLFRSEIEHEVLPSQAPRQALSGWIYSPCSIESCCPALLLREMPDLSMPENATLGANSSFVRTLSTSWCRNDRGKSISPANSSEDAVSAGANVLEDVGEGAGQHDAGGGGYGGLWRAESLESRESSESDIMLGMSDCTGVGIVAPQNRPITV